MKVKVERCLGGYFRLTMPGGERENVNGDEWTREVASRALDVCEHLYGMDRSRVRFQHS